MIEIYDGSNYARVILENDTSGLAPRNLMNQMLAKASPVIWIWDGKGGNSRRRELFPDYKKSRKPMSPMISAGFSLINDVLKFTPIIQVQVPNYEGDDVVATLTRHYVKAGHQVAIFSNDFDFSQLTSEAPDKVFAGYRPKPTVKPEQSFYYKICVGDPSDCIPGIKGFGLKTWGQTNLLKLKPFIDLILDEGRVDQSFDLPVHVMNWINDNVETIQTYAKIIQFFDVPMSEIDNNMTIGKADYAAGDAYLKGFFQ